MLIVVIGGVEKTERVCEKYSTRACIGQSLLRA